MNRHHSITAIILVLVLSVTTEAQEPDVLYAPTAISIVDSINATGNIYVNQPEALNSIIRHTYTAEDAPANHEMTRQASSRSGYRVQIFDDNNPRTASAQAKAAERHIESAFPNMRTYVTFNSPYWRVKAGDFRTRAEAEAAMASIRETFPQYGAYLRVVRDRINIQD